MSSHLRALGGDLRLAATLSALNITFLADQAWLMGDAIARTQWRLFVSRRQLLEWTPAAQMRRQSVLVPGVRRPNVGTLSCRDSIFWRPGMEVGRCDIVRSRVGSLQPRVTQLRARNCGGSSITGAAPTAPHLAVLRDICDGDDNMCRQTSRRTRHQGCLNFADQMDCICFQSSAPATSVDWHGPTIERLKRRSRQWFACRAFAATSTIGTTLAISRRSNPNMCPPSTAAIWRAISSRSPMPAKSGGNRRWPPPRVGPESPTRSL